MQGRCVFMCVFAKFSSFQRRNQEAVSKADKVKIFVLVRNTVINVRRNARRVLVISSGSCD